MRYREQEDIQNGATVGNRSTCRIGISFGHIVPSVMDHRHDRVHHLFHPGICLFRDSDLREDNGEKMICGNEW